MAVVISGGCGIGNEKDAIIPDKSVAGSGFAAAVGHHAGDNQFFDAFRAQFLIQAGIEECAVAVLIDDRQPL